jgi:hypothetical protein
LTVKHKGIKWPSPSNIISDVNDKSNALTQWAANMVCEWVRNNCSQRTLHPNEFYFLVSDEDLNKARFEYKNVSERALDVGTQVHDAVRMFLQAGKEPSNPDDEVLSAFVAFLEFYEKNEMKTEKMEERLFLDNWCMQYDWYGLFKGKPYLIDFKTSKAFYREMRIQTAAYRSGLETTGHLVDGHGVIRLDKESGKPEWKDYSKFYTQDLNEFMLSKELYFARHPRIRKQFDKTVPF